MTSRPLWILEAKYSPFRCLTLAHLPRDLESWQILSGAQNERKVAHSFPGGTSDKEPACLCRRQKRHGLDPWVGKIPGGGNGNPLQYSCLKNPMDRRAWWTTVWGVATSQTRLKTLSTSTEQEQTLPQVHASVQVALPLGPYESTYSMVLEVAVTDRDALRGLWQDPIDESWCRLSKFWSKVLP